VVRLVGGRDLILRGGAKRDVLKIAWGCHCLQQREMTIRKDGETRKRAISVGHRRVKLPFYPRWLFWVVVKGFGEKPLMLLTDVEVESLGAMRVLTT
jgi:hypothetical protein